MLDWFWITIGLSIFLFVIFPYSIYSLVLPPFLFPLCYGLHLLLVAAYWLWTPPQSLEFRQLPYWRYFLQDYFAYQPKGPGTRTLDTKERVIYAMHPHGVFASSVSFWALSPHLLHCRGVGSSLLFYIPLVKELISLAGIIRANRQDIITTLECGESVVMTPGGMREVLTRQEMYTKHHGFLKIAKATNTPVVPVYAKGVDKLYTVWLFWPWLQSFVLHLLLYPIYIGSWGNPWLPFWPKRPLNGIQLWMGEPIVVGKSIEEAATEFYNAMDQLKKETEIKD